MPNWCENELLIEGRKQDLKNFMERAKGENGVLDMNSFIPYSEEEAKELDRIAEENVARIKEAIKNMSEEEKIEYIMSDGCSMMESDWCCENWGTKWNFYEPRLDTNSILFTWDSDSDKDIIFYRFLTAWSPPEPVIRKMAEVFPQLKFELRYFEGLAGFNGILILENGKVIIEDCAKYYGHRGE